MTIQKSNSDYYPVVLIPDDIKQIRYGKFNEPVAPTKPLKPMTVRAPKFSIGILIFPIIGLALINFAPTFGFILLIIFIIAIISYFKEIKEYPKKIKNYNYKLKLYESQLLKYIIKMDEFEMMHKNKDKIGYQTELRLYNVRKELENSAIALYDIENKCGLTEEYFSIFLENIFKNQISRNKTIEIFDETYIELDDNEIYSNKKAYIPDFVLRHKKSNLHIDIEIDEPYLLDSKKLIHTPGYSEYNRDKYFLDKRWIIIRFAEEQILESCLACCKSIAEIIEEYTGDNSYLRKCEVLRIENIKKVKRWTKKDIEMVKIRYRENYLEIAIKNDKANLLGFNEKNINL
jgi:hypothetical protein